MSARRFPPGFRLGAATSAQQIEGGAREGGRGESVWDRFAGTPGKIADGSDPSVACDHYHRWREDVGLMRELGLDAYRFSVGWTRILPDGRGPVNEAGLDFYDALVDALLAAGITPLVTLDHWDLPQALDERGGWGARDTAQAFVDHAAAVAARLGDRVKDWITHNEPWCIATLGHERGEHAPGRRDPVEALRAAHHVLLSHGWAVPVLRRESPGARVGITHILSPVEPATASEADRDAARRYDGTFNRWYLEPIFRARYPDDVITDHVRRGRVAPGPLPFVREGDLAAIAAPTDFLGVNYYSRSVVAAGPDGEPVGVPQGAREARTEMGWEVWPRGLTDSLLRLTREYAPREVVVTENGAAFADTPDATGHVADARRVEYLRAHLEAALDALDQGVPLTGYYAWSLLDNFEWDQGYARRFGLYRVDFATQRRTPKDSAYFYRELTAARTVPGPGRPLSQGRTP
jgi:beta-glucosidase